MDQPVIIKRIVIDVLRELGLLEGIDLTKVYSGVVLYQVDAESIEPSSVAASVA